MGQFIDDQYIDSYDDLDHDPFFDEVSEPSMAAPGGEPTSDELLREALAHGPIMTSDFWDAEFKPVEPAFFEIEDGDKLLYQGKSHVFIGEPGKGKTMLTQKVLVEEAAAGRTCLFIDMEKSFDAFLERIRALGATKETAGRIGYWRLTRGMTTRAVSRLVEFAAEWRIQVVVIDSFGRAVSRAGLDENNNDHVRTLYDTAIEPLLRAGMTVVLIDHFKKPDAQAHKHAPVSRYAKGAGAKLDVIDGAAYGLQTVKPFSRQRPGMVKVVGLKSNNGSFYEGQVIAEVNVTPKDDGRRIDMVFAAPESALDDAGEFMPTFVMEKASKYLEGAKEALTMTAVRKELGGNTAVVGIAVEKLIELGHVSEKPGPRSARLLTSVSPYRQGDEDPSNPF